MDGTKWFVWGVRHRSLFLQAMVDALKAVVARWLVRLVNQQTKALLSIQQPVNIVIDEEEANSVSNCCPSLPLPSVALKRHGPSPQDSFCSAQDPDDHDEFIELEDLGPT